MDATGLQIRAYFGRAESGDSQGFVDERVWRHWFGSGGPSMPRPYSNDLRARVIEAIEAGASRREAADRYREGNGDHPARDAGAMASRGFPPLLALEIPQPGRPATNRCRPRRVVLGQRRPGCRHRQGGDDQRH
jgi:hypothetical protein